MRILAEERKNGTEVLLITSPASITSIVLGKYFGACFVFFVMILLSFIYPIVLLAFGGTFTVKIIGGYIGFILLGMTFISVGVFASSLTESQVVAVIISYVALLIMWIADSLTTVVGGFASKILGWISLLSRYGILTGAYSHRTCGVLLEFYRGIPVFTVRVIEKDVGVRGDRMKRKYFSGIRSSLKAGISNTVQMP